MSLDGLTSTRREGELLHWCESRAESVGHLSHLLLEGHSLARPAVRACVGAWVRACVRACVCGCGNNLAREGEVEPVRREGVDVPGDVVVGLVLCDVLPGPRAQQKVGQDLRRGRRRVARLETSRGLASGSRLGPLSAPPGTSPTRPAGEATRTCGSVSQSGQLPPPSRQLPPPAFPAASAQHGNGVTPPPSRPA